MTIQSGPDDLIGRDADAAGYSFDAEGTDSTMTPRERILSAVVVSVFVVVLLTVMVVLFAPPPSARVYVTPIPEAVAKGEELRAAFAPWIPQWLETPDNGVHRAVPVTVGLREQVDGLYYGFCGETRRFFYIFVILPSSAPGGGHYAYLPNGSLRNCNDMAIEVEYEAALGGGWYDVRLSDSSITALRRSPLID